MPIDLSAVNYLAVLVAGLAAFFIGGFWYQALFGKLWVKLHGYSPEKVLEMKAKRPPALFFGGMIAAYIVLAFIMAILLVWLDVKSVRGGLLLAFLIWVGPALCIGFTDWLASVKHIGIFYIDMSYQLVFLMVMGAILGAWR